MTEKRAASQVKTERLLNLVLALLSSERYLTKSQIVSMIPGYEGAPESQDRMFERDKDDLRKIGIDIEVKQVDPLFEDEIGYRIRRGQYISQVPELTVQEGLVASVALSLIGEMLDAGIRSSVWMKLSSLHDEDSGPFSRFLTIERSTDLLAPGYLPLLLQAVQEQKLIHFDYERDSDAVKLSRFVEPLRLERRGDVWLLIGWDRSRNDFRKFIIENMANLVMLGEGFERREMTPISIGVLDSAHQLEVKAERLSKHLLQMEGGKITHESDDEIQAIFKTYNLEGTLRILLSLGPDVQVISPPECVDLFRATKQRMIDALR